MSETRPSFWTTLPGILTGLAALIAAVTGVVALVLNRNVEAPVPTPQVPVSAETSPRSGAGASSAGQAGESFSVQLETGNGVDVDTAVVGSDANSELFWISNQLNLHGPRNAVVPGETDEAGCRTALVQGSDDWLTADRLAGGAVVCLSTDQGAVALARISPPDATDRIAVELTVWPQ